MRGYFDMWVEIEKPYNQGVLEISFLSKFITTLGLEVVLRDR